MTLGIAAGIADHVWRLEAVWRLDHAEAETRGTGPSGCEMIDGEQIRDRLQTLDERVE